MPIDSSIYFKQQTPDIMGGIQRGLAMSDMMQQRQMRDQQMEQQDAIKQAAQMSTSPDIGEGTNFDHKMFLSKMWKINPQKAMQLQGQMQTQAAGQEGLALKQQQAMLERRKAGFRAIRDESGKVTGMERDPRAMNVDEKKLQTFEKKEGIKEDVRVRTENRKERRKLDQDYQTWDALESQIDDAIAKTKEYNAGFGPGTGNIGYMKGMFGSMAPERQSLNASLQKLSLDQMVKQFAGMSKAIDTPAERAQFESTVPSIGMDNELLMEELMSRKKAAQSAKDRISSGKQQYDKFGRFHEENNIQEKQATKFMKKNGVHYRKVEGGWQRIK